MAGRRSRWVEVERKERQRNTSFATLPSGNRGAHGEKTQPARKLCCRCVLFPPVSKKKRLLACTKLTLLVFLRLCIRLSENPAHVLAARRNVVLSFFLLFFSV